MPETLKRLSSYRREANDEALDELGRLVERGGFQLLVDAGSPSDRYALLDLIIPCAVKWVEWMT